jgi:hypothetical protein
MEELTTFDKINLAACAVQRALPAYMDEERFLGEYATASLWKAHRVVQTHTGGRLWGFVSPA